jgi:hypothetical protein
MQIRSAILLGIFLCESLLADSLPVFTAHPQGALRRPGTNVTLTCGVNGADSLQWRHNGDDVPGATNSILTISNAQSTHTGYYLAIAKNAMGWVPSQMAYLNVTTGGGVVPFQNIDPTNQPLARFAWDNGGYPGQLGYPISYGEARLVVGPQLDQMSVYTNDYWYLSPTNSNPNSGPATALPYSDFSWYGPGYFGWGDVELTNIAPGQTFYYKIQVSWTNTTYVQPSTTLKLVAGGSAVPTPSTISLSWPANIDWPYPNVSLGSNPNLRTNLICVSGETTTVTVPIWNYGYPVAQWRKDGREISGATNVWYDNPPIGSQISSLILTNIQASDAGVYDVEFLCNNWVVSPRIAIRVQTQNGAGIFQTPRQSGSKFQADFVGAAGRNYMVECSTNLLNWTNLITLTNTTGTLVFSNNIPPEGNLFYRSRLLP